MTKQEFNKREVAWAQKVEELEEPELLELQKQFEFMQYAEDAADLDAEFYGVA